MARRPMLDQSRPAIPCLASPYTNLTQALILASSLCRANANDYRLQYTDSLVRCLFLRLLGSAILRVSSLVWRNPLARFHRDFRPGFPAYEQIDGTLKRTSQAMMLVCT